ncbi:DNA cytosine methyltransferase [Streptomyces goshikiensis]|uniref:DNA cytosine methyltransferase n=1 Tax=Streptomyces goshikiensis TaxID=1942 RepID=UPI002ADF4F9D|nr:DNA cytosine methyltransferase [Streptomyces goshikiensis]
MTPGDPSRQHVAPLHVMDLFAGCGGFAEGFRSYSDGLTGEVPAFQSVASVEWDPAASATFEANHRPQQAHCGDIAAFDPNPFADQVDVVTGGPPCQGFSALGKQDRSDPRNLLWQEYQRVVVAVRPKIFVMENVDRYLRSPEYELLEDATKRGGALADYALSTKLLNAADFGVPQARRRVIVIGTHRDLGSKLEHPEPTHAKQPLEDEGIFLFGQSGPVHPWVPVDAVFQRSARMRITGTELPSGRRHATVPGPYATPELHFGRSPMAYSLARYRNIPPGGNRNDLRGKTDVVDGKVVALSTEAWDRHNSGSGDVMGRLRAGTPSVTIRTEFFKPEKGRYLHPYEDRPITHYEAALIQGFPEHYQWYGTKVQIARQIGNAVPVGLARVLAEAIHRRLSSAA